MKIVPVSSGNLAALLAQSAQLEKVHNSVKSKNQKLAKLEKQESELQEKISAIESDPKPGDSKQAASLGALRNELELVRIAIGQIDIPPSELDQLRSELRSIGYLIKKCLEPTRQAFIEKITETFRVYSNTDLEALGLAVQSQAAASLGFFTTRPYEALPGVIAAQDMVAQIEAGEIKWNWPLAK